MLVMARRGWLTRGLVVAVSSLLALMAAAACVLLFLQPWRYCPEIDDSSAGCPMLPRDLALLQVSIVAFFVAVLVLVLTVALTLVKLDTPSPASRADGDQGHPVRDGLVGDRDASERHVEREAGSTTARPPTERHR